MWRTGDARLYHPARQRCKRVERAENARLGGERMMNRAGIVEIAPHLAEKIRKFHVGLALGGLVPYVRADSYHAGARQFIAVPYKDRKQGIGSVTMNGQGKGRKARGYSRRLRLAALAGGMVAFGALVAPAVGNAFSSGFDSRPVSLAARGGIGSFTPASVDPRLARQVTMRALSHSGLFRFTPADDARGERAITVAVRVDGGAARAISVRNALAGVPTEAGAAPVRIAPSVYSLGLARGYNSFAISGADGKPLKSIAMPDLSSFAPGKSTAVAGTPSRFGAAIEMDEKDKAGRAPRTFEGQSDYQVDLGGSYRLTRNLKVTAGVRYSSERDRLAPLTDGTKDSQAVYVGTQFRF